MAFGKQLDGLISKAKDQYGKYQASQAAPQVPPRPPQQQQHQYYPANAPRPAPNAANYYPAAAPHFFPGSHLPQQQPPPYQQSQQPPYQQQQQQQYGQQQYGQPQYGQPQYGQPQYQPPFQQQPYQQPYQQSPQSFQQPPPVPPHPSAPSFYYRPIFSPNEAVSLNFEHKLGDHGWGNNEKQNYLADARNSFHTPSHALVLRAIVDPAAPPPNQYTSARLASHQTLARDRGFLNVRLTAPSAPGIWPAFWLLPREPFAWPSDGEVDIFEAWNAARVNHACLHWGHFNGEDWDKHRVIETPIPDLDHPEGRWYGFAWDQPPHGHPGGRMVWYVDGRPVMKADIPPGTRRLSDFQIIINIAMGGNVNGGVLPSAGYYDMVIHSLKFHDEPTGGWGAFEQDWAAAAQGKTM